MNILSKRFLRLDLANILSHEITLFILLGIIGWKFIFDSPYAAGFIILAGLILVLFWRKPLHALSIFIIFVPYSNTELFRDSLVSLPGAKPLQLVALFVIIVACINYKKSTPLPKFASFFAMAIITVFTISIIRSLAYLDILNWMREENLSTLNYMLSDYVKPLIFFLPLIIISKFTHKLEQIEFLVKTLVLSIMILSIYLLYLYLFKIGFKGDLRWVDEYYSLTFGLHRNDIANFFMIVFPLCIARFFLKKNFFNLVSIGLSIVAIGFLYSRTAYLVMIISFLFYLFISKRSKFLPVFLTIAFGLSFIVSASIIERASKGLEEHDLESISAGRIDGIWLPLIEEHTRDSKKLLLGNGRYGMKISEAAQSSIMVSSSHPHNMYLEQIVDAGLIGFIIFILFFILLLQKISRNLHYLPNGRLKEYHYAIYVSIISYMLAGMTGRSFFPMFLNSYLWIVIGIAIALIRMLQESKRNSNYEKA